MHMRGVRKTASPSRLPGHLMESFSVFSAKYQVDPLGFESIFIEYSSLSLHPLPALAFELCHVEVSRIAQGVIRSVAVASAELSEAAKHGMSDEVARVINACLEPLRKKLEKAQASSIDLGCLVGLLAFHHSLKFALLPSEIPPDQLLFLCAQTSFEKFTGRASPPDVLEARLEMLFGAYLRGPRFLARGNRAPSILCLPSTNCLLDPFKVKSRSPSEFNLAALRAPQKKLNQNFEGDGLISDRKKALATERKENFPFNFSPLKAARSILPVSSSRQHRKHHSKNATESTFLNNNQLSSNRDFSFRGLKNRKSQKRLTVLQLGMVPAFPDPNIDAKIEEKVQQIEGLARKARAVNLQLEKMKILRHDLGSLQSPKQSGLSLADIHAKAQELKAIRFEPERPPSALLPFPSKPLFPSAFSLRLKKRHTWQRSLDQSRPSPKPF